MSFFLDLTMLLPIMGLVTALLYKRLHKRDDFLLYILSVIFLFIFYSASILIFCDFGFFGILEQPTEFMYSSGIFEVPFNSFEELALKENRGYVFLGVFLFCLYPLPFYMGIHMGFALFGRNRDQKGMVWFFK